MIGVNEIRLGITFIIAFGIGALSVGIPLKYKLEQLSQEVQNGKK